MNKGIVFSFEALIALLFFALILMGLPFGETNSLKELILLQQENDLLKVWSVNFPNESEMVQDTSLLFDNFELFFDEKKIHSGNGKNSIASEAILIDNDLIERKVRIVVYFD